MNILFVCTGNTCRSPMAEALAADALSRMGREGRVVSAGLYAYEGGEPSMGAVVAMGKRGLDLSAHRATQLTAGHMEDADIILGMTSAHVAAIASMGYGSKADTLLHAAFGRDGSIADPFGGDDEEYDAVAKAIERAIDALLNRLCGEGGFDHA